MFWSKFVTPEFSAHRVALTSQPDTHLRPSRILGTLLLELEHGELPGAPGPERGTPWGAESAAAVRTRLSRRATAAFSGTLRATRCTLGLELFLLFSWFVNRIVQKSMQINPPNQNLLS